MHVIPGGLFIDTPGPLVKFYSEAVFVLNNIKKRPCLRTMTWE